MEHVPQPFSCFAAPIVAHTGYKVQLVASDEEAKCYRLTFYSGKASKPDEEITPCHLC
jgi:hypothetical protein